MAGAPVVIRHRSVDSAAPGWRAVLAAIDCGSVFARPEWSRVWLSVYGGGRAPMILEVRDQGRTVALLPLMLSTVPWLRLRTVAFIGGEPPTLAQWLANPSHPGQNLRNDVLAIPGSEALAVRALRGWLEAHRREWDVLRLTCVPATSALVSGFATLAQGWSPTQVEQVRHRVDVSQGWDAFKGQLSKRQRRHLRYEPNALERAAGGELSLWSARGEAAAGALEDCLDLTARRWSAEGRPGLSRQDAQLFRRIAAEPESGVVVHGLSAAGRLLACQLGFDDGLRYTLYHLAFDPDFDRQSPAQVLMQMVIRHYCEAPHEEVDLSMLLLVDQWTGDTWTRRHLRAVNPRAGSRTRAWARTAAEGVLRRAHALRGG